MAIDTTLARSLIQGFQRVDPRLYEALNAIIDNVDKINDELFERVDDIESRLSNIIPVTPTNFQFSFLLQAIQFTWNLAQNAFQYEIRLGGTDWDSASFVLRTTSLSALINPKTLGTYVFRLKSISTTGDYSPDSVSVTVVVDGPSAVFPAPTATVIDNNVLIDWDDAASEFQIDYYILRKNSVQVGTTRGTFATRFETIAGTYTYGVIPVDIAGNQGPESSVVAEVDQPPDFVLETLYTSDLSGTKVNCIVSGNKLYATFDPAETWENHFTSRTWDQPQDQLDAGYPYYLQPNQNTGSYEEIHDFGSLFTDTIISISYSTEAIIGTVAVQIKISTSTDNVTYTPYVTGSSLFSASFRYVKFKLEFTGVGNNDLATFFSIQVALQVKEEVDSGFASAVSTDAAPGTTINFNKSFRDVNSVTATTDSENEPYEVVVSFVDTPNPTGFSVMVFDTSGNRKTKDISWKARGIV